MLTHAQELVYHLTELMPTQYQKIISRALLGLFLEAQGHPYQNILWPNLRVH
jgi:hypothetical protein